MKWLVRALVVMLAFAGLSMGVIYVLVTSSLPDYDDSFRVNGIVGPVEIVRGEYNVPHVFGSSDQDVFFGLGFVHAQDRLWQMAINRQFVQGRLSEVFGERTLSADRLMHSLDLYRLASEALQFQDGYTKDALTAYSAGVNAWIDIINRKTLGRGSPEFYLFDMELRPWNPVDSLALLSLNAFDLSPHMSEEILRQKLLQKISLVRARDLMPMSQEIHTSGIQTTALPARNAGDMNFAWYDHAMTNRFATPGAASGGASNSWAIMPEWTPTGGAILANDPHLRYSAPSIWMLARIELANGGLIGATIPGIPLILMGRSSKLSWGLTYSYLDDQDLYFEQLDPSSSSRYLTPEGFKEFDNRVSVIAVAGNQPYSHTNYWTENGPVIDPSLLDIGMIQPEGHVVSLAWTLLEKENLTMSGALRLMRSRNIDEAIAAGELIRAPALNIMLAEKDNIAFQTVGAAPLRHIFNETLGQVPSAGWKHQNRWHGELPYEYLPRSRNPDSGFLANTNNRLTNNRFPWHISHVWGDTTRIDRVNRILHGLDAHSVDSTIAAQNDVVSEAARKLLPLLARNLWHTISDDADERRSEALQRLQSWVGNMDEFNPEPLIYVAWTRYLMRLLIQDELGSLSMDFARPDFDFIQRVFMNVDGAGIWCDIAQTAETEDCDHIAAVALDQALASLVASHGEEMAQWRWGNVHLAAHDHEVLGGTPYLSWLFNIRHSTPGGDHTINRSSLDWSAQEPYISSDGPGYRAIYNMASTDDSMFIISTGQSGHVLSRHYDDLGTIWRTGDYIPMSLNHEVIRNSAIGRTVLEPSI